MLTLLRNAEIFAPEPLGRRDLLVAAGRIEAISPRLPEMPEELVTEIDLEGARLIPGLVDSHVHLTGGGGESGPATRVPPVVLSAFSKAGITSVVGLLGTDSTTRSMADLVGRTLGLREEGLSAWCWTGSYEVPVKTLTGSVRSDMVFVDPIIGVGELAISDHRSSQPTFDEFLRVAADVHVGGLMSGKAGVLHLHLGDGRRGLELVRRAIEETELSAQVFHPTHVNRNHRLFAEALALSKSHGVCIDVTAFPADEDGYTADEAIERCLKSEGFDLSRLTCSSDGAGCLPVFDAEGRVASMDVASPAALFEALGALLQRGHALETVLPIFTSNVARVLRLEKKGRIGMGMDADLVVLDGSGCVRDVMALGRWLVQDGEVVHPGRFEKKATKT